MNKIKYLNDGRKVVVIGEINSNESIVQEIFVTKDGDEIPSGERFTTKSLHDEPVMSYQEKRKKDVDRMISQAEGERDKIQSQIRVAKQELKSVSSVAIASRKIRESLPESDLSILTSFLSGNIQFLVVDNYIINPPIPFNEAISYYDNYYHGERNFEGIKLISLYGQSDGDLSYKIHKYSDGSGGASTIHPFNDWDSAVKHIKNRALESLSKGNLRLESFVACKEMGITFTKAQIKLLKKQYSGDIEKSSEQKKKDYERNMTHINKESELFNKHFS